MQVQLLQLQILGQLQSLYLSISLNGPIIAITPSEKVRRSLALNSGVTPLICNFFATTDEIISEAKKVAKQLSCANDGDNIIIAAGLPTTQSGGTNMLKIERV